MKYLVDLRDKSVLITGASSGIGAQTAMLCSELGARVILVARREEKLQEVAGKMEGEGHRCYAFDFSHLDAIEGFINTVIDENGPLDGFVHSVGYNRRGMPLRMLKADVLRDAMDIYFNSFVETSRCITKRGHFNPGLSIVGISSVFSQIGTSARTAYCASKAAMNASVRCMARELSASGVRANVVCPGMINTERLSRAQNGSGGSREVETLLGRQYLGFGQPADIANAVAFLLSDASRLITGTAIDVDGGILST